MEEFDNHATEPRPGRLVRWGPTLMVAAMLAFYLYVGRAAPAPPGWGDDFTAAVEEAAATDRRIVVEFYSEGCPPCVSMSRSVLGADAVQRALSGYVSVRLDAWRHEELSRRVGVFGTPTYVILDTSGLVYAREEGYRSVEEFVGFLQRGSDPATSEIYSVGPLRTADS